MAKRNHEATGASADADAFRAAMSDVKPLPESTLRVARATRKPRRKPRHEAGPASPGDLDASMPLISTGSGAAVGADEALSHRKPGVRDQQLRRLRRGQVPIEADLDLHGLSQSVARDLTARFIDSSRAAGLRCVRIIHGKGMRSGTRGAILKSAVSEWLRRHPDVVAFASARPLDGGTGAAYVLLRA